MNSLSYPIGPYSKPNDITSNMVKQWMLDIQSFPILLEDITHDLNIKQLHWNYRPNGWNIKQVVHHCSDSHMHAFVRFKLALTEENPTIKPYEEQLWAQLMDGNTNTIDDSMTIIHALHSKWSTLMKSMTASDWSRTYIHPTNGDTYSLQEAAAQYSWHCRHHLAHVQQALESNGMYKSDC